MIAASEEFINRFRLRAGWRGTVDKFDLHIRAAMAGHSLINMQDGGIGVVDYDVALLGAVMHQLRSADLPRTGWVTRPDQHETEYLIDLGMPFVGWSIGSESRRIDTPAQPGEGDFIKYLGRA